MNLLSEFEERGAHHRNLIFSLRPLRAHVNGSFVLSKVPYVVVGFSLLPPVFVVALALVESRRHG